MTTMCYHATFRVKLLFIDMIDTVVMIAKTEARLIKMSCYIAKRGIRIRSHKTRSKPEQEAVLAQLGLVFVIRPVESCRSPDAVGQSVSAQLSSHRRDHSDPSRRIRGPSRSWKSEVVIATMTL